MIKRFINVLKNLGYHLKEYEYLKDLIKSVKRTEILNKTVVINTVRTFRRSVDPESFIGLILALNGAKVKILIDDGLLYHWDTFQVDQLSDIKKIKNVSLNPNHFINLHEKIFSKNFFNIVILRIIRNKALKIYSNGNLEFLYYSDIINRNNINYKKWQDLRKFAKSSTIRFFKNSDLDFDDEYVKYYYKLSLMNAILTRNVGEYVLNEIKPDYFISGHGIYSIWGPPFDFLKENGIKTYSHSGIFLHSINHKSSFVIDAKMATLTSSELWAKYKDKQVTEEMKKAVQKFMKIRANSSTKDLKWIYNKKQIKIYSIEKNKDYKYYIGIFPHVIWDGNIQDRHIAFNSYLDWLLSTINYVKNRKDFLLYIKSHPAELILSKKTPRVIDRLKKYVNFEEIENIVLIPPEKTINTYEFLKSGIDLGLVYDGFLSIEMPYLKIPTITCVKGGSFSVDDGNFTITSREEYFKILDNVDKIIEEFHKNYETKYYDNIVRYLYWYIYENKFEIPIISFVNNHFGYNLFLLKTNDFKLNETLINNFN